MVEVDERDGGRSMGKVLWQMPLVPVLLGDGVQLFGSPGTGRIDLERTSVSQSGPITNLRLGVLK